MSNRMRMKKRIAFCPSVNATRLEERVVLSTTTAASLPAAPPVYSSVLVQKFGHPLTKAQLRADYEVQVKKATADLKSMIKADIQQLRSSGAAPTAQQQADFNAMVDGAIDATALRLSSQAALLPNSVAKLVPAIQNELLGSGSGSLASRLGSLAQSSNQSTKAIQAMVSRQINVATRQNIAQVNNYFATTPVNSLSVNSSGQPISLKQYIGGQLANEVANTLGTLAQSFPDVANAALYPNGTTSTVDQNLLNTFTSQYTTALNTAAFQIGSALALFPGSSNVASQIESMLFNSSTNTNTNSSTSANNLASALQNLDFGSSGFNTAVSTAFNNGFQNVVSAISPFFGIQAQSNLSLPTSGLTNLFGSQFSSSNFNSGFNNGFATGTSTGFTGFGTAPTSFNTSFGTGFNNLVSTVGQHIGLLPPVFIGPGGIPIVNR